MKNQQTFDQTELQKAIDRQLLSHAESLQNGVFQVALTAIQDAINKGARLDVSNSLGVTPLHLFSRIHRKAELSGIIDAISKMPPSAYNINTQTKGGRTPLHHAVSAENRAYIEFLLKNGANPDIENKNKISAVKFAWDTNQKELAMELTQKSNHRYTANVMKYMDELIKNGEAYKVKKYFDKGISISIHQLNELRALGFFGPSNKDKINIVPGQALLGKNYLAALDEALQHEVLKYYPVNTSFSHYKQKDKQKREQQESELQSTEANIEPSDYSSSSNKSLRESGEF